MGQQLANGREMFSKRTESRQKAVDTIFDFQSPLTYQQHDRQCRRQRLGQRRQVEDGIGLKRGFPGNQGAITKGPLEGNLLVFRNQHHCAGENSPIDGLAERVFNQTKSHFTMAEHLPQHSRVFGTRAEAKTAQVTFAGT
jgi:hypothetical protein